MVERRTITLTSEQLQALALEKDPIKRAAMAARFEATEQPHDLQPYRPANNPTSAYQAPAPGGTTYHRSANHGSTQPREAKSNENVAAGHGIHDPNPRFEAAAREVDRAQQHQRELHTTYFPRAATEVTARPQGPGAGSGREGPQGPDAPNRHGPGFEASPLQHGSTGKPDIDKQRALTPQQQKVVNAYEESWREKFGETATLTPEHRNELERLVSKNPLTHKQDLSDLAKREGYIEETRQLGQRAEQSLVRQDDGRDRPQQNCSGGDMTDQGQAAPKREREQTARTREFEARRNARIADAIAKRLGDHEHERGRREDPISGTTDRHQATRGQEREQTNQTDEFEARRSARIADAVARRRSDRGNERGGREEAATEMTDRRQVAQGREREQTDQVREFEARRSARIANAIARRRADRGNEGGGRED